jgi:uncharacterized protein YegL
MENNKAKIFNLLILDESGSMAAIREQTISGFNEILQSMQSLEKDFQGQSQFVSMYTFNNQDVKTIHDLAKVSSINPISNENYRPDGGTPLLDALGKGISQLEKQIETVASIEGKVFTYQVLVTVLTDGCENSSRIYSKAEIRAMIDRLEKGNWTFTYIGADHDVFSQSSDFGIKNVFNFSKTEEGLETMLKMEKDARMKFNRSVYETVEKPTANFFEDLGNTEGDNKPNDPSNHQKSLLKRFLGK